MKLKKIKPNMCEYCGYEENNDAIMDWSETSQLEERIFVTNNELSLFRNKSFTDLGRMCVATAKINYCPMCGREFGKWESKWIIK